MKIKTRYHGEVEINQDETVFFENGIPGFLDKKKFVLLPLSEDDIFQALQSVETDGLAFVVTNPFHFFTDYDFTLEDSIREELNLHSEKDVMVYSILTVQDPFEQTTANLQAPIIINGQNRKAKQVILHDEAYKTKHPIFMKTESEG